MVRVGPHRQHLRIRMRVRNGDLLRQERQKGTQGEELLHSVPPQLHHRVKLLPAGQGGILRTRT